MLEEPVPTPVPCLAPHVPLTNGFSSCGGLRCTVALGGLKSLSEDGVALVQRYFLAFPVVGPR